MKSIRMLIVISLVATIVFLCIGAVSAQSSNAASVTVLWVTQPVRAGQTANAVVTFTSNSADQIVITRVGFHFDWMETNQCYTSDLSANPVTVPPNGVQAFSQLSIQIPPYVTAGSHNYYVAIDGEQGFAWDSETKTVEISGGSSTTAPTSTPTPGGNGGQGGDIPLNYLAIAATAIVVVVALVVVVMWTRRKKPKSAAPVVAGQSDEAKPEEKPAAAEDEPAAKEDKEEAAEYSI